MQYPAIGSRSVLECGGIGSRIALTGIPHYLHDGGGEHTTSTASRAANPGRAEDVSWTEAGYMTGMVHSLTPLQVFKKTATPRGD